MNLTEEFITGWSFDRPIYPELVDYDDLFRNTPGAKIIPCGEVPKPSEDTSIYDISQIFQDGTKDLNFVASCECGALTGNFYEGIKCKQCDTVCKTNFTEELKFRAWLYVPDGNVDVNDPMYIPPLLHPAIHAILNQWMGTIKIKQPDGSEPKFNILDILLNPEIPLPEQLVRDGIGQGYQYFYRNFLDIINYFMTRWKPLQTRQKKERFGYIPKLIETYKDLIFFRHIPILNQSLHMLTKSGTLNLTDNAVDFILKAKINLDNLLYQHRNTRIKPQFINVQLLNIYKSFLDYVDFIAKVNLFGKTGFVRKLILGARTHCSGRAVITPISGEHSCDELYLPWKMGVELLKLEIINLLVNRYHYKVSDAITKQNAATVRYDEEVDVIMKTLIQECHDYVEVYVPHLAHTIRPKGLPVLFGRNPSLRSGAIMLYFVTKIKTDLRDDTISVSSRCATAPNFDFDGDAMYLLMIKEMDMLPTLMKLHPSLVMVGGMNLGISGDVTITKQEAINLTAWLDETN